jgi:antitoxin component YwqK of YwqJK toxin-antitoxin module
MTLKLFTILLTFSFVCVGQTEAQEYYGDINYKNIIEIKDLIYFSSDTTLVTGKVIRYNKKNEAKKYILVSNGKPDDLGWIQIKEKYQEPEKKLKTKNTVNVVNEAGVIIGSIEDQIIKYDDQMSDRNDITKNIQSNIDASVLKKPRDKSFEDEVLKNNSINNEVDKNGIWEEYYSNGNLESKGVYIDGKEDGLWQEYYENSQLKRKTIYKNGVEDGLWLQYHSNGQLWSKGHYKDGRMIGEWNYYDEKGKLLLTENYDN